MSNLPTDDKNTSNNQAIETTISTDDIRTRKTSKQNQSSSSIENRGTNVETRVDILVKNPEIILLEDQQSPNSNCLVLNVNNINI